MCSIALEKNANIKHVVIGTLLAYMVNGATLENLKQLVAFKSEMPYLEVHVGADPKYVEILQKV